MLRMRCLGVALLVAASLVAAVPNSALPIASASPPLGAVTLTPSSGTSTTSFTMVPPAGASCSGSGVFGYRWQTYIIDATLDASSLVYDFGPTVPAGHF